MFEKRRKQAKIELKKQFLRENQCRINKKLPKR
jgi:hypothetical protein